MLSRGNRVFLSGHARSLRCERLAYQACRFETCRASARLFLLLHSAVALGICILVAILPGRAFGDGNRAGPASGVLRVLIVTGRGGHDWRVTVPFLRRVLADTGRFDGRVCEVPSAVSGRTLSAFDVLVDDCGGSAPGSDTSQAIAEFVDSGKGLVITRGALSSARSFRTAHGGGPAVSSEEFQRASGLWQVSPFEAVPRPAQFLEVRIAKVDHPIVHGLRSDSKIADAAYPGMIVSRSATVIARAKAENEPEETSESADIEPA